MLRSWITISLAVIGRLVLGISAIRSAPAAPPTSGGCPLLPADNIWNVPIDALPVDPNSSTYVNAIGAASRVKPHGVAVSAAGTALSRSTIASRRRRRSFCAR
jgi:hypothetical protein